jgi:predicted  nucleic acid-binding Zn-ribbon protein
MTISAESLRELHHLHKQIATLRDRLERGPKQIKAGQVNVTRLEQQLDEAKQAVKKAKVNCDGKQLQLKSNESRINDWKGKLNAAKTNKEYQALKEQIAADEMANSVLSDEILEMFDKITETETAAKDVEQRLGKSREEIDKVTRRISDEHATLETELKQYKDRLATAESKLPASFKADYDRVVRSRGDEALAPLEGESCGGCNVEVTPQMINEVKMNQPVFCKSCGCLLYAAESA